MLNIALYCISSVFRTKQKQQYLIQHYNTDYLRHSLKHSGRNPCRPLIRHFWNNVCFYRCILVQVIFYCHIQTIFVFIAVALPRSCIYSACLWTAALSAVIITVWHKRNCRCGSGRVLEKTRGKNRKDNALLAWVDAVQRQICWIKTLQFYRCLEW